MLTHTYKTFQISINISRIALRWGTVFRPGKTVAITITMTMMISRIDMIRRRRIIVYDHNGYMTILMTMMMTMTITNNNQDDDHDNDHDNNKFMTTTLTMTLILSLTQTMTITKMITMAVRVHYISVLSLQMYAEIVIKVN